MGVRSSQYVIMTSPVIRGLLEVSAIAYALQFEDIRPEDLQTGPPEIKLAAVIRQLTPGPRDQILENWAKQAAFNPSFINSGVVVGDKVFPFRLADEVLDGFVASAWEGTAMAFFGLTEATDEV